MASTTFEYQQFFDYWAKRLERDIAPFIDPGTELKIARRQRSLVASWTRRTRSRTVEFLISHEAGVSALIDGQPIPYRAFLASGEMADLLALAKMTLQAQKEALFVETKAKRKDSNRSPEPALKVLRNTISEETDAEATVVVMVTGEAGTGKTSVLKQLVRNQSDSYTRGQTQCLYLYINAQGRALARFHEALATELDELRATLTYHEVPPLVRAGLVIPVVDGFDELLGVGGYDDALSSLSAFIEELDGSGQLIASARSTYYEQEFVARANKSSSLGAHVWRQVPVEILEWGRDEFNEYIDLKCAERGLGAIGAKQIRSEMSELFSGQNEPLRSKPFFVSRTVEMRLQGQRIAREGDLLEQLVENYIERERKEKLLDRQERPMLTNGQIRDLLIELAEEMWNQETRELDQRSVREVTDYLLQSFGLPENSRRIVTERVTAFAFLMTGEATSTIAFEHEVFFAYFLAYRISRSLSSNGAPAVLLGRSILPLDAARIAARILEKSGELTQLQQVVSNLRRAALGASIRASQTQENAGVLTATSLMQACRAKEMGFVENLELGDIVIPGLDLSDLRLRNSRLTNVEFRRARLIGTKIENCKAEAVTMIDVTIDPDTTRLELDGLDVDRQVIGLQIQTRSGLELTYDPGQIRLYLRKTGVPGIQVHEPSEVRKVPQSIVTLLERFARLYLRANPVCTTDDTVHQIFGNPEWDKVQERLISAGVVTKEFRFGKGRKQKLFLRRQVLPEEIVAGRNLRTPVPPTVKRFWQELEAEYSTTE
jgi:hypothetical protein